MPKRSLSGEVFLNVPFDAHYENLYLALIAGVTLLGLTPRCVLEIKPTTDRLSRLLKLISQCQFSIHDLSRVQLDSKAPRCPRFNMPFELGLAVGCAPGHHWTVFEAVQYRLQKSLSDLNGYDHLLHHGTVTGLLRALLDVFEPAQPVSLAEMKAAYSDLKKVGNALKTSSGSGHLYRSSLFRQLVLAAKKVPSAQGTT